MKIECKNNGIAKLVGESERYGSLSSVVVTPAGDAVAFTATDGKALTVATHAIGTDVGEDWSARIEPKIMPAKKHTVEITGSGESRSVRVRVGETVKTGGGDIGRYPNAPTVVPEDVSEMATILVEIKALRAMLAAIEGNEGSAWLIVDQKGERLMVKSDSGFGVLMGMTGWRERLAEAWQQATALWRRGWNHQVVNNWGQK